MFRYTLPCLFIFLHSITAMAQDIHVNEAWIKEAPPGVRVMAGYLRLKNGSNEPLRLSAVSSPEFDRVEMHRSVIENDVVRMEAQDEMTVAPHDTLTFEPGGYHLMLYDPRQRLAAGDQVKLQFIFTDGRELSSYADVRRGNGGHDDHHQHHHHH